MIIGPNSLDVLGQRLESPVEAGIDMIITKDLLDELSARAKASARLRCNLDLRNSEADGSQRMLNALEPGTVILEMKDGPYHPLEEDEVLQR